MEAAIDDGANMAILRVAIIVAIIAVIIMITVAVIIVVSFLSVVAVIVITFLSVVASSKFSRVNSSIISCKM